MVVKATGYGDNSYNYTRVVIDVKDVNDNRPVFSKPMYNVTIRGRIDTSVPVLTLHATDADQDGRQRVVYSFDPRNKKFLIDPNTGILCVGNEIFGPTDFGGWSYRLTHVRPSVRSFVCPDFFSITGQRIFLIFCMKLDIYKG